MRGVSVLWAGLFAVALVASALVGRSLEARGGGARLPDDPLYLPSATFLRYASLGYRHMLADFMWIRATQYFGSQLEARTRFQGRYQFLFPMLDLATSLDPQYIHAYRFGGLLLIVVRQYENAISLYEKGYAANPGRWEMPHDLGRLYYLELKDYAKALQWWKITKELPGRPEYIPRFIPLLYLEAGQREIAIALWLEMYQATDNALIRHMIRGRLESFGVKVGE